VATRVAMEKGFCVLGAEYGLEGLLNGQVRKLNWMDVSGWASRGGSELGAGYYRLQEADLPRLAQELEARSISAMLLIGGSSAYQSAHVMATHSQDFPALAIPAVVIPASINNNLPGSDFAIGADTALNNIIGAVDKIKDTAGANRRVFIVQVMGYHSGYLAIFAGLASGAEDVFIPEEGVTLQRILEQVRKLGESFARGRRLALIILNEVASKTYDVDIMRRIMEEEGGDLFDVRSIILGHIQRGGAPTPFDRILASRLAAHAVSLLAERDDKAPLFQVVGLRGNRIIDESLEEAIAELAWPCERQKEEWFIEQLALARSF